MAILERHLSAPGPGSPYPEAVAVVPVRLDHGVPGVLTGLSGWVR